MPPGRTGGAVRDRGNSWGGCPDLEEATPSGRFELGKAGRRPPAGNREASGAADCNAADIEEQVYQLCEHWWCRVSTFIDRQHSDDRKHDSPLCVPLLPIAQFL